MAPPVAILAAFFLLGAYAVTAQATLLREAQVLLLGNELAWGLVLAFWLAGVALGATVGGRLARRDGRAGTVLAAACLAMPAVLVAEVALVRLARPVLGVGPGEYVGPVPMLVVSLLATLPVSVWVGLAFPAASAVLGTAAGGAADKARRVGWVYLAESAGSLAGGALYSFVLVERVDAVTLACGGGAVLAAGVCPLVGRRGGRRDAVLVPLALALLLGSLVTEGTSRRLDALLVRARWRTFAPGLDLVEARDTRYQNLALGRRADQFSLYSSGLLAATWPNPYDLAVEAHLAACQHPRPKRMLLLGGGEEGLLRELLRHDPERVDLVMLDPAALEMVRPRLAEEDRLALDAPAVRVHFADARRFVKRSGAGAGGYDLVVLALPQAASTLEARLYTREFFAELADAMAEDGVLAFALTGSVGYWSRESAHYVSSIIRPLEDVFPDVLLTFGQPTYCFASRREGVLRADGAALAARYRERRVASPFFDALWFEGASDLLDADKRASVRAALAASPAPLANTDDRPAAALYHMRFWLAMSAAAHPGEDRPAESRLDALGRLLALRPREVAWAVAGVSAAAAAVALLRGRRGLGPTALAWSVGTTGFASMALEVVLLYTFQVLYGYVYGMVGLIVGVFMFGLVLGSAAMNRRLRRSAAGGARPPGMRHLAALDLGLTLFSAGLVLMLDALRGSAAEWPVQAATFGLVALAGVLGGLVFPLAAAVALADRPDTGRAAGAIDAADHVGACLGALATGTLLVPILGASGACLVVALVKAMSAALMSLAAMRKRAPAAASSA